MLPSIPPSTSTKSKQLPPSLSSKKFSTKSSPTYKTTSTLPPIPEIAINGTKTASSKSQNQVAAAYRERYAAYLAATFGISIEAATADVESVLTPRKRSDISEEEVDLIRGRSIV